jgi:hypothetical protein
MLLLTAPGTIDADWPSLLGIESLHMGQASAAEEISSTPSVARVGIQRFMVKPS